MTTTVKVTAHNHPTTVTVTSTQAVREPANVTHSCTATEYVLSDVQSQGFVVTDTQSVSVEEHVADQERDDGIN